MRRMSLQDFGLLAGASGRKLAKSRLHSAELAVIGVLKVWDRFYDS